jgi:stage II sporulation protein D
VSSSNEPVIRVGLMTTAREVRFNLFGIFRNASGEAIAEGDYIASSENGAVKLQGKTTESSQRITLNPVNFDVCRFTVSGVKIGLNFHWEREESQRFQGALTIKADNDGLTLINELPLETYLISVISSEMSASSPPEFLKAHAIVSRSWLLAQLHKKSRTLLKMLAQQHKQGARPLDQKQQAADQPSASIDEIIRWYDRESHLDFDVCADDHCQRYQGISKAFSQSAFDAVHDTRGKVLVYGDDVCDARYSKSCGGMTETYSAVWEDEDVPYLKPVYDGPGNEAPGHRLPLSVEVNAEDWITSSPLAYCEMVTPDLIGRILPGFDQETRDFYRWEIEYSQEELSEIIGSRLGIEFGRIRALVPLERGESGRIIKLKIAGEKRTVIIGKELEIRRALSRSHLYSSAFIILPSREPLSEFPSRFKLVGAGWGHGVGLCQIGAAVMADRDHGHEEILNHYFTNASVSKLY